MNDAARLRGELALKYERCVHRTGELADKLSNDFKRAVSDCRAENAGVRAVPPPVYFADEIPDPRLDTDPAVFQNIRDGLQALTDEHAELEPFVKTLNAEIAEISELRADLETTISETFKAWEGEAVLEWEAERRGGYTGKRDSEFVPTIKGRGRGHGVQPAPGSDHRAGHFPLIETNAPDHRLGHHSAVCVSGRRVSLAGIPTVVLPRPSR